MLNLKKVIKHFSAAAFAVELCGGGRNGFLVSVCLLTHENESETMDSANFRRGTKHEAVRWQRAVNETL